MLAWPRAVGAEVRPEEDRIAEVLEAAAGCRSVEIDDCDFPQAVDFSSKVDRHQKTREAAPLLLRDLQNVETYFKRNGVSVNAREVFTRLLPKLQPDMGALDSESPIADGKELR